MAAITVARSLRRRSFTSPAGWAEPTLLKQVFVNLLSNALKYSRHREVAHIEVGSRRIDSECAYFVKDNGAGFDMQYANKLFGVFQRLHRADEYEGTGVGLAIVQRIVHRAGMAHKGEKRVKGFRRSDIVLIVDWFTKKILESYGNGGKDLDAWAIDSPGCWPFPKTCRKFKRWSEPTPCRLSTSG
jgi:Histidine kinase-, DNA gyrase B-, and HSP90-like ATPase